LCCPGRRRYYDPLRLPLGRLPLPGAAGYRQGCDPGRRPGAEEDLSSSEDNPLAIPRPLRREVPGHPLQDPWCRPWPSPSGKGLGSSSSAGRRTGVTTLQASLHVADWSVARPRSTPGLSTTHGGSATGDLGVSPDRTRTGWLPSACRLVTSQQPPCCHGAQAAGRTPRSPVGGHALPGATGQTDPLRVALSPAIAGDPAVADTRSATRSRWTAPSLDRGCRRVLRRLAKRGGPIG
jgi:hypothetical protein